MAGAYGTFAAGGVHRDPTGIMKVTDRSGNVLVDNTAGVEGKQVITDSVAYAVTQVLEGVIYNASYAPRMLRLCLRAKSLPAKRHDRRLARFVVAGYTPQLFALVSRTGSRDNSVQLETNTWCQDMARSHKRLFCRASRTKTSSRLPLRTIIPRIRAVASPKTRTRRRRKRKRPRKPPRRLQVKPRGASLVLKRREALLARLPEVPRAKRRAAPRGGTGPYHCPDPGSSSTPGSGTAGWFEEPIPLGSVTKQT